MRIGRYALANLQTPRKLSIAVVYHSQSGNTALLAESVRDGALEAGGVQVELIPIGKNPMDWNLLASADAIIFGCPTHMGSASADFKGFMDDSVGVWFQGQWRNKIAAGFTNSANLSGDKLNTLMQLTIFAAQHGMIWIGLDVPSDPQGTYEGLNRVGSWLGSMGTSDRRRLDGGLPPEDRRTAHYLGRRVANASKRWHYGNQQEESKA